MQLKKNAEKTSLRWANKAAARSEPAWHREVVFNVYRHGTKELSQPLVIFYASEIQVRSWVSG